MVEIYNTLTRQKEEMVTRDENQVNMYVCGPTTYNFIHLGNARPLVIFDTVRRYLKYKGYQVNYIQNFTDVDDKIINRAAEEGQEPLALAQKYIKEYFTDADALNVLRADKHPRVSQHIPEIINMVQTLIDKGFAYEVAGTVFFDVRSFPGYGKLSGRSLDDMQAGARVEVNTDKKDPMDFALWKNAKPGEPYWESPWGKGRPGWHIECSAMSLKYLGSNFDIHGGGFDLIFPHHENEIAQSEGATGNLFVRYWMHNGFITINKEKMSKSLGNFFLVRDILQKFSAETVRFYLLSTHYRSPLDFDDEKLQAAQKGLERLQNSWLLLKEAISQKSDVATAGELDSSWTQKLNHFQQLFEKAMDDDFNTALAFAVWFDLARDLNGVLASLQEGKAVLSLQMLEKAEALYHDFNGVLGVFKEIGVVHDEDGLSDQLMAVIIEIRQQVRKNKDWATADAIRDRLHQVGIILEDTPQGVRWKKQK